MSAKDQSLGVSLISIPTFDLNLWLSTSTRLIRAMGAEHTVEAIFVMSSYDCSGLMPEILHSLSALILSA